MAIATAPKAQEAQSTGSLSSPPSSSTFHNLQSDTQHSPLLSLPPEIRIRIYGYLFNTSPTPPRIPLSTTKSYTTRLARTCRLLRIETKTQEHAFNARYFHTTTFILDILTTPDENSTRAFKRDLTAYCDTLSTAPIQKIEVLFLTQQQSASVAAIATIWINEKGEAVYEVLERGGEREAWDDEEDSGVIVRERAEECLGLSGKDGKGGRLDAGTVARWVLRTLMPIAFDEVVEEA